MTRDDLRTLLNGWLEPARFKDVAENDLQVEGRADVRKVVTGVSANLALIDAAIERDADAIVVHHGIVWGGIRKLDGWLAERVRRLMRADVSLFAYHLPLDAHPTLGNNAGLADALSLDGASRVPFGHYKGQAIGMAGERTEATSLGALVDEVREHIGAPLAVFGDLARPVRRVGLCSGGAPDLLHEAIDEGLDVFVTGEVTEWVKAVAEESGVAFIAAGHHQTERFGPRRLGDALAAEGLEVAFVDVDNPA